MSAALHEKVRKLDWDAQALALITEIAFGWVQDRGPFTGTQEVWGACLRCEVETSRTWQQGMAEDDVEAHVLRDLVTASREKGCPHIEDYIRERLTGKRRPLRDALAMAGLLKHLAETKEGA